MKTLVIGDIHGCYKEFLKLLDVVQPDTVYSVGDLIDRGPNSIKVVNFCIDNDIKVCLGNHELMFIDAIQPYVNGTADMADLKFTDWWVNGGDTCFKEYRYKHSLLNKHLEYFKQLPVYYRLSIDENRKPIIISHSMITHMLSDDPADVGTSYNIAGNVVEPFVWNRTRNGASPKFLNIHGHSPTDWYANLVHKPYITDNQINLDTGCAYKEPSRGYLTGIVLETMEIYQIQRI